MERQHTPGTWEIRRPAHITWSGPTGAFEIYTGDKLICQRPWAEGNPQAIQEYEANARLIAAAPDLLEACILLTAEMPQCASVLTPGQLEARRRARAALAKATGVNIDAPA